MIEQTFLHMAGVGHAKEQRLWQNGFRRWDDLWKALNSGWSAPEALNGRGVQQRLFDETGLSPKHAQTIAWIDCLDESRKAWQDRAYGFFTSLLKPADQWRLLASAAKDALYLDIETTGLSKDLHYTTVIGALFDGKFHQWVWPQPLDGLRELLQSARLLVTFNGKRFDVPFLQSQVPDLSFPQAHVDLLYIARAAGFKGGQKALEESLGLRRKTQGDVHDGSDAVLAWCRGLYGDRDAFRQLLAYNREDVEMMPQLAARLCAENQKGFDEELKPRTVRLPKRTSTGHTPSSFASLHTAWRKNRPGLHLLEPKLVRRFANLPKVVGIDLRAKAENPTGWAVCQGSHTETAILWDDEEILAETLAAKPDLVSIDAPLALPRGRKSVSDDSPCRKEGGIVRDAERILWARGIRVYPALIRQMQRLTERGIRLTAELESHGIKVIESYPGAAQDVLGIPRKKADESLLTRGLRQFGFAFRGKKSHDELDAITSALVGYFYLADEYEAIGADDECFMIIPRWNSMNWSSKNCRKVISLVGLPGAGKTTLTRTLAERFGWSALTLGEALRERATVDHNLADDLNRGFLAPEPLVEEIVRAELQECNHEGLVLDGFPRHVNQVSVARKLFPDWKVIYLDLPETVARNRLIHRGGYDQSGLGNLSLGKRDGANVAQGSYRQEDRPNAVDVRLSRESRAIRELLRTLPESDVLKLDASLPQSKLAAAAIDELLKCRIT